MKFFQVVGGVIEIVETDNSFGFPVSGNRTGDIFLKIDKIDTRGNRVTQQHQPLFLALLPTSAILATAAGYDHLAGTIVQQPSQVHTTTDVVKPQFDQLDPLFGQVMVFGDHMGMSGATDADTNHGIQKLEGLDL
jgi:hypothetical protein